MDNARTISIYADPQCPYAWITVNWLWECEQQGAARVDFYPMSLAALNEGKDLPEDYRAMIDESWGTSRVCAALKEHQPEAWPAFYRAYGQRRHVLRERDGGMRATTEAALADAGLPASLIECWDDTRFDDELRRCTTEALGGVEGGAPMIHLEGRAFFGPVLTQIPRGQAAVDLLDAIFTLARTPGFGDITGVRDDELQTS